MRKRPLLPHHLGFVPKKRTFKYLQCQNAFSLVIYGFTFRQSSSSIGDRSLNIDHLERQWCERFKVWEVFPNSMVIFCWTSLPSVCQGDHSSYVFLCINFCPHLHMVGSVGSRKERTSKYYEMLERTHNQISKNSLLLFEVSYLFMCIYVRFQVKGNSRFAFYLTYSRVANPFCENPIWNGAIKSSIKLIRVWNSSKNDGPNIFIRCPVFLVYLQIRLSQFFWTGSRSGLTI